ncbi:cAMP-independent regulatory protein [Pseudohyphozyma bogoriensis]|nr:cAMP-independent regulatory protein [Pseudohyphozyma bogoriensis]
MADPAFRGFVESTLDALLIFEGCQCGVLPKITRRLQEFEKRALVVSGAVFVFDEEETGIKRWTDGLSWSPSRTLGNFLIYRELDKKNPANANASAAPGAAAAAGAAPGSDETHPPALSSYAQQDDPPELDEAPHALDQGPIASTSTGAPDASSNQRRRSLSEGGLAPALDRARERALVGSLTSSYRFRPDGLVKKTLSLNGLHMVGYYKIEDVTSGRLRTPSSHAELISLEISSHFLTPSLFRIPPLVDTAPDGQLRYKGEPETPMSPMTRSGSSQGFGTPGLGSARSRPPSQDSSGQLGSPRLGQSTSGRDRDGGAPGSPHRGSSMRGNRFDPYLSGRPSPNLTSYANPAPSYPFPISGQGSPVRATFSTGIHPGDDTSFLNETVGGPVSPLLATLSSSAPQSNNQWGGAAGQFSLQRPVPLSRSSHPGESTGSSFYQPRHATPFDPNDSGVQSPAGSTSAMFAYQAPPPPIQRRHSRPSSPPMSYPSYAPPQQSRSRPPSAQQYHHPSSQLPPDQSYIPAAPPPTSLPYQSPHLASTPALASYTLDQRPQSSHSTTSPHLGSSTHSQPTYYPIVNQSPYPSYSMPQPQPQSNLNYGYADQSRLASGLVMGMSGDVDEGHGLGLGQDRLDSMGGGNRMLYSSGGGSSHGGHMPLMEQDERGAQLMRTVKRETEWDQQQQPLQQQPQSHQHQWPTQGGQGWPTKSDY